MPDFLIDHAGTIFACAIALCFLNLAIGERSRRLYR